MYVVEFLTRVWEDLVGRVDGPMKFRLILQPVMASLLAIRAGLRDARAHKPPFFWALLCHAECRREMLRSGWKDISRIFLLGLVLDVVYQIIALHTVYPGEAVVVAILVALFPYILVRGPVTRLFRRLGINS